MNLKNLAELAGVSVSTVSKAFHGSHEISAETREHIFQIAKDNGCFEKYFKHKFEKKVVAVIFPEIQSDYYTMLVNDLEKMLREKGIVMVTSFTNFDKDKERELLDYYASYAGVDGIIIVNMSCKWENVMRVPLIALLPYALPAAKEAKADIIKWDITASVEEAIRVLKKLGHTRIGFAGEMLTTYKLEMYKKAMRKAELVVRPSDIKMSEKRFEEAGIENMDAWLASGDPPTAILAAYDYIAVGLAKSIHSHGKSIPEDFSIIGMDDIPILPYMKTSISSIKSHTKEACRVAVETLLKKMEIPYYSSREDITIQTELILRESVGAAVGCS